MKPTGDYTAYFADADIYLNWGDILTVLIPTSSALSGASTAPAEAPATDTGAAACPICLSPPTAPRMTKCGHVYCFPCILQYLATTDGPASAGPAPIPGVAAGSSHNSGNALQGPSNRQWKRCPICWDAVYARDLKAVKWWDPKSIAQEAHAPTTSSSSEYLRLRLIERPQITTLALPQSSTWPTSSTSPSDQPLIAQHQAPWHFQPDVMTFCKFMLATPDLLLSSLSQDIDELAAEKSLLQDLGAKPGDHSIAFADLAEKKVREQMAKVVNELDTPAVRSAMGQATNDLKEHVDAEQHRIVRENENLSRRQRRQQARQEEQAAQHQQQDEEPQDLQGEQDSEEHQKRGIPKTANRPPESSEGAEAFLAFKSAGQGGSYTNAQPTSAPIQNPAALSEVPPASDSRPTKSHAKPKRNINPPAPSASSYLFYQAASGQNIFLHPLDIKIMLSQFGVYSRFPRDIAVKVQNAEEGSMNEELRKRCKYLTHLPKATDVVFIEVDWEAMANEAQANGKQNDQSAISTADLSSTDPVAPLVDRTTLRQYDQILRARRNKRRDRERKEDRAKLKAEQAEAASRPGAQSASGATARNRQSQHRQQQGSLSQSYTGSEDARSATSGTSPTFMEAALWGAERDFPIHPGGGQEDFPAPAPSGRSPGLGPTADGGSSPPGARPIPPRNAPSRKTVWGTPAAEASSFSSTLHASSRRNQGGSNEWDEDIDDAWLELEEGFVMGTNNSKQVRAGRGLNKNRQQQHHSGVATNSISAVSGGSRATTPAHTDATTQPSQQSEQPKIGGGKKQRKAKLVLTSGGRGTA